LAVIQNSVKSITIANYTRHSFTQSMNE